MKPRMQPPLHLLLLDIVRFPFTREGWPTLLSTMLLLAAFKLAWLPGLLIAGGLLAMYSFDVIRWSWKGRSTLPPPSEFTHLIDVTGAAITAATAGALAFVPYWIYAWFQYGTKPSIGMPPEHGIYPTISLALEPQLSDTVAIGLLGLGAVWAPVAIMLAAVESPLFVVLNPLAAWPQIRRMGVQFLAGVLVFWACMAGWYWLGVVAHSIGHGVWQVLPMALFEPPRVVLASMAARTLGVLLRAHGAELGYGQEDFYFEPVLGDRMPMEEDESQPRVRVQTHPESIELEAEPPPVPRPVPRAPPPPPEGFPAAPAPPPPPRGEDLMSEEDFLALVDAEARKRNG